MAYNEQGAERRSARAASDPTPRDRGGAVHRARSPQRVIAAATRALAPVVVGAAAAISMSRSSIHGGATDDKRRSRERALAHLDDERAPDGERDDFEDAEAELDGRHHGRPHPSQRRAAPKPIISKYREPSERDALHRVA
jgi:hypothetical protein